MCTEFPTRFNRLFRGPMWSNVAGQFQRDPLHVNIKSCKSHTRLLLFVGVSEEWSDSEVMDRG